MNIPPIHQLIQLARKAASKAKNNEQAERFTVSAVRDAVVAACRPQLRPIAEMPDEVPEGCVRVTGMFFEHLKRWRLCDTPDHGDTHFIDIALPEPTYPDDFEQAFAESKLDAKDKDAAFKLWKGGAR